jgi:peroxiredoxin
MSSPETIPIEQLLTLSSPRDLAFDGTAIFGGPRSKRYALEIEDGKVKAIHVEPDNTGLNGNPFQPPPHQSSLISS